MASKPAAAPRRKITLTRTYQATPDEVWEMWTTPQGIEAWWGPDGFEVKVRKLELQPGGALLYDMIAVGKDQVAFMRQAGAPLTTAARIRITEVSPPRRLAYLHAADFIPGVEPYEVAYQVDLEPVPEGTRLTLTFEAMHDELWTGRAVQGWEMELRKLERALIP
jgi:uncharacterized protein YndB with AHSA1/START domain